jgi:hypothetical protein
VDDEEVKSAILNREVKELEIIDLVSIFFFFLAPQHFLYVFDVDGQTKNSLLNGKLFERGRTRKQGEEIVL